MKLKNIINNKFIINKNIYNNEFIETINVIKISSILRNLDT